MVNMKAKERLIVFGDSFVEGTYYTNGSINSIEERQTINFAKQLGEILGIEVVNYGRHANSNLGIYWDVKTYLKEDFSRTDIVLVCWTGLLRTSKWNVDTGRFENDKYFFENTNIDYFRENWQAYSYIKATYTALISRVEKFYFISSFLDYKGIFVDRLIDDNIKKVWINYSKDNNTLYGIISQKWGIKDKVGEWNQNHREYSEITPYINLECRHPNQKGHKLIASTLSEFISPNFINSFNLFPHGIHSNFYNNSFLDDLSIRSVELEFYKFDSENQFKENLNREDANASKLQTYVNKKLIYRFNSYGLRGPEFNIKKPFDLFLGCSFTMGVGVYEEKIWPTLVANHIKSDNYINAGMTGKGPDNWYAAFKHFTTVGDVRNVFCFCPSHPRLEERFKGFNYAVNITSGTLNSLVKDHPQYTEIFNHVLVNKLSDISFMADYNFKTLATIKHICQERNINFFCYTHYSHGLFKTIEKQIARDIHHPGESYHEFIADTFIEKYQKNNQELKVYPL